MASELEWGQGLEPAWEPVLALVLATVSELAMGLA